MDNTTNPIEELALQVFPPAGKALPAVLDAALWSTFWSTGLDQVLGSGEVGALADTTLVLRAAGRSAARIPAAEAILGQWLALQAGWEPTSEICTVLTTADNWDCVPWGRFARVIYAVEDGRVVRHHGPFKVRREGCNIAGEPRDALSAPTTAPERSGFALSAEQLLARSALLKAAMMAGAMDQLLQICVAHALEREQFGQPIAQFQAVQQMLAALAAHGAAAGAAVDLAAAEDSLLTAAVAKARASEAALTVTDAAHQITGAMGFTTEFPLQQLTRRLWAWRDESGSEQHWHRRIGEAVASQLGHGLWPLLSSGQALRQAAP